MVMRAIFLNLAFLVGVVAISGCASPQTASTDAESPAVENVQVDLPAFMGRWHVIAAIPTLRDRRAHDALYDFHPRRDGRIDVEYFQREDSHQAEWLMYRGVATVQDVYANNHWRIVYTWPRQTEFRIRYLSDDYRYAIVGDERGRWMQFLSRDPLIADTDYSNLMLMVQNMGYDISKVRRVPQKPE